MNTLETAFYGFATGIACMSIALLARTLMVGLIQLACHSAYDAMKPKSETTV